MENGINNVAETLAREMKEPTVLAADDGGSNIVVALPAGWKHESIDREFLRDVPRRARAKAVVTSKGSFVDYVTRHKGPTTTVWCKADMEKAEIAFQSLIDDNAAARGSAGWRAHTVSFTPAPSVEWQRWMARNDKPCGQEEFAVFIEDNQKDIVGGGILPGGGQMLAMALDFQAKRDMSFKSAIRTQSGGVNMQLVDTDDAATVAAMAVYERFAIAIPVFRDDTQRYQMEARLRYRVNSGKLSFYYQLIRPDLQFESSATALFAAIDEGCGLPFFFGTP